jgi:hypothetical protein
LYLHAWSFALHLILFVTAHLLIPQISINPRDLEAIFFAYHSFAEIFISFWLLSVKTREPL